jgi:cytochrome c
LGVPFEVWNEAALQLWLVNPRAVKANTRMRIPTLSERDRNDIIAWFISRNKGL